MGHFETRDSCESIDPNIWADIDYEGLTDDVRSQNEQRHVPVFDRLPEQAQETAIKYLPPGIVQQLRDYAP